MPRLANKYAPDFQSAIEQIALKWEMAPEAVFSLGDYPLATRNIVS